MKCAQKVAYRSQAKARQAMLGIRRMQREWGRVSVVQQVYRCHCGAWHLTSRPKDAPVPKVPA